MISQCNANFRVPALHYTFVCGLPDRTYSLAQRRPTTAACGFGGMQLHGTVSLVTRRRWREGDGAGGEFHGFLLQPSLLLAAVLLLPLMSLCLVWSYSREDPGYMLLSASVVVAFVFVRSLLVEHSNEIQIIFRRRRADGTGGPLALPRQ